MKNTIFLRTIAIWLPIAVAVTGLAVLVYVTAQQNLRQGANDPQVQMAEDAVRKINAGEKPQFVVSGSYPVELSDTLEPFLIATNEKGDIITSDALLDGGKVKVPLGALEFAKDKADHRVTWQPRAGVREAIVIKHFSNPAKNGYIIAGRSLREVESRSSQMLSFAAIAWVATLLATLIVTMTTVYIMEAAQPKK